MSKYQMNKFMRAVEMSDRAVAAYVADPSGFVDRWLAEQAPPGMLPDARELTAEERTAFATRDYGELYRLGAHPYLLWHFTEAVYIHEFGWRDLVERYRATITPHGSPDYIS